MPQTRRPLGEPDPPSYLVQSILVTIFCCQVFGIVAIVYAALTISATGAGDWEGAQASSAKARMWLWIGALSGILVGFLYFMFFLSRGTGALMGTQ